MRRIRSWTGRIYRGLLKPIVFRFDPEQVHDRFTNFGQLLGSNRLTQNMTRTIFAYQHPMLETDLAGLKLPNPVGLSAGFDKNCYLPGILPAVGFGFAEIGSVTKLPYAGNPRPRLHRLSKSQSIVVYYGLKNDGVDAVLNRFPVQSPIPLGLSIAKSNDPSTNTEKAGIADYIYSLHKAEADPRIAYLTINISCPNTFGGEPFTTPKALTKLLDAISKESRRSKPIFVKVPIDHPWKEFAELVAVIAKYHASGVVIGNLTKNRQSPKILDPLPSSIKGGLSGKPTEEIVNEKIRRTYEHYGKELPIIGVGGVFSAEDAYTKLRAGASAIQLITGMIFRGPQLIGEINQGLVEYMQRDGYRSIAEIVGVDSKG